MPKFTAQVEREPSFARHPTSVIRHETDHAPVTPVALARLVSQFAEGGANGNASLMPNDPDGQKRRHQQVRETMAKRNQALADRFRTELAAWYGQERSGTIQFAEAFELCEYGAQPDREELKRLFPFFGN